MDARDFAQGLSQLGFAFHYRVAAEIENLRALRQIDTWSLVGAELPVALGVHHTRIDLAYERVDGCGNSRFLVVECKRVNPKYGIWCFAKSPYPFPDFAEGQLAVEGVRVGEHQAIEIETRGGQYSKLCYNIAFALKAEGGSGDAHPVANDKDAIESACGQVCLGASGLAQSLISRGYIGQSARCQVFFVLPMIVTTAKLHATDVSLTETDLCTGDLELGDGTVQELPWLIFQYMQSPQRIIADGRTHKRTDDIVGHIAGDAVRSVAVVNAHHIADFFRFFDRRG